jgi:hypothetical protein
VNCCRVLCGCKMCSLVENTGLGVRLRTLGGSPLEYQAGPFHSVKNTKSNSVFVGKGTEQVVMGTNTVCRLLYLFAALPENTLFVIRTCLGNKKSPPYEV